MTNKEPNEGDNDMMKNAVIRKNAQFTVNLMQLEGEGSFPCPKCATMISPDDETEEVYKIVDTKLVNHELVELVIECGTCGTVIKLTGFQASLEDLASE